MAVVVEPKQYLRYSEGWLSSTPAVAGKLLAGKFCQEPVIEIVPPPREV